MAKIAMVYLYLQPLSTLFYDQQSGLKLLPKQQIHFPEDDIPVYKRLETAIRHGHVMKSSSPQKDMEVFEWEEINPKKTETPAAQAPKAKEKDEDEDDDNDEDEDEQGEEVNLEEMTAGELKEYILENSEEYTKKDLKNLKEPKLLEIAKSLT
jgi:hypothetical protein